jgi:hypothetical protein
MAQKKSKTSASSHLESSFKQCYNRVHKILSTAQGRALRATKAELERERTALMFEKNIA